MRNKLTPRAVYLVNIWCAVGFNLLYFIIYFVVADMLKLKIPYFPALLLFLPFSLFILQVIVNFVLAIAIKEPKLRTSFLVSALAGVALGVGSCFFDVFLMTMIQKLP